MGRDRQSSPIHPDAYGYGLLFTFILIVILYIIKRISELT